jgi:hypothetical protein
MGTRCCPYGRTFSTLHRPLRKNRFAPSILFINDVFIEKAL